MLCSPVLGKALEELRFILINIISRTLASTAVQLKIDRKKGQIFATNKNLYG